MNHEDQRLLLSVAFSSTGALTSGSGSGGDEDEDIEIVLELLSMESVFEADGCIAVNTVRADGEVDLGGHHAVEV